MTRYYSIPSETPPDNGVTSTIENSQFEVDSSDWELRMARLVGFEEEFPATDAQEATNVEKLQEPANLQSPASPVPEDSTEQPLSSNPFAKLILVGTATFSMVLLAGVFLTQLMSGSGHKPTKNNTVTVQKRSQPTTVSRVEQLEGEIETLKTKLALAEQAQAVKLAQQKLRSGQLASPQVAAKPTSRAEPSFSPRRTPTPVRTVYVPKVVTVERIVKVPEIPQKPEPLTVSQISPPPPPVAQPETQPSVQFTPTPTPDPLEEWSRLAKLGSYGQVLVASTSNRSSVNASTPEPVNTPEPVSNTRVQPQTRYARPEQTQQSESSVISQAKQQSPKSVTVGTSTKAVLATAVFGETSRSTHNSKNEGGKNVFVVRLKEPLKATDGSIVLPAKTELLTEISSLSDQGLLQLNVVKMMLQNHGNLTERSLPQNAIQIRGSEGRPLVANQFSKKGSSLLGMDVGQFVLGGIGKAAELFNRNESQVTTTATGTIVTNSNSQRNIWAGVLEGGIRTVVPQIAQRNQQAMSQISQRSNVWFLPAGTEVEVYINQTMQL